jgi:hypothetical protein
MGLIDSHLRMNGEEARLPELERFWPAVYGPSGASASSVVELELILAQRQGFEVELLPFIEAAEAERLGLHGHEEGANPWSDPRRGVTAESGR